MKTNEDFLKESGFSSDELQKLRNNIANYGGTLDSITHDLANRFIAAKWISIVAIFVFAFMLIVASNDTITTLAITLVIVLPFVWFLAPAKLAYKSWRYRKMITNAAGNR